MKRVFSVIFTAEKGVVVVAQDDAILAETHRSKIVEGAAAVADEEDMMVMGEITGSIGKG